MPLKEKGLSLIFFESLSKDQILDVVGGKIERAPILSIRPIDDRFIPIPAPINPVPVER